MRATDNHSSRIAVEGNDFPIFQSTTDDTLDGLVLQGLVLRILERFFVVLGHFYVSSVDVEKL